MKEFNPNHKVTSTLHDHWHKVAALFLLMSGKKEIAITEADLARFQSEFADCAIVCKDGEGTLRFWLVNSEEAERLARQEGGLAI